MMTFQDWINNEDELENCLHIGEEIDDKMAGWLISNFPSDDPGMIQLLRRQAGSACDAVGFQKNTYNTFKIVDGKWRYSGRCFMNETENKHHIYLLYFCNEWKEWSSMRIAAATTNPVVFRRMVKGFIESGDMEYGANAADLDTLDFEQINSCLEYGNIMVVDDGAITD